MPITDVAGKFWLDLGGDDHNFRAFNFNKMRPGGLIHQTPNQLLQITAAPKFWLPGGVPLEFPGATLAIPAGPGSVWVYLDSLEVGAAQLKQSSLVPTGDVFICARVTTDGAEITAIENILIDNTISATTAQSVIEQLSTGRVEFDGLTRVSGLTLNVGAGRGYVKSGPPSQLAPATIVEVTWSAANIVLADDQVSHVYVDSAGTISFSASYPDPEQAIILGTVRASDGELAFLSYYDIDLIQKVSDQFKYLRDVVGPVLSGGLLAEIYSGPSLEFEVGAGTYYIAQDRKTVSAIPGPAGFTYWYRDGLGGWTAVAGQTALDDGFYDDGSGTLAAIPAGKWKNDRLMIAAISDTVGELHVIYAQEVYDTEAEANNLVVPAPPGEFVDFAMILAVATIEQGSGEIATLHDVRPRFGATGLAETPITDHGLLAGLGDDDHPQYQRRTEKGVASGYAGLDGTGRVPHAQLPPSLDYFAGSTAALVSGATSYTDDPALFVTPGPGTYLAIVSLDVEAQNNNTAFFMGIGLSSAPGTVIANSERLNAFTTGANRDACTTMTKVTVPGAETVHFRFYRSGGSTVTLRARTMMLIPVEP